MVKVGWQLWVVPSGKSIKVWVAASLWDIPDPEDGNFREEWEKLKKEKEEADLLAKKIKVVMTQGNI